MDLRAWLPCPAVAKLLVLAGCRPQASAAASVPVVSPPKLALACGFNHDAAECVFLKATELGPECAFVDSRGCAASHGAM